MGCSAPYPPASLVASPETMSNGNPCPVTSKQVAPGTLRFTRNGPGDPKLFYGAGPFGVPGYCNIDVSEPGRGANEIQL